VAAQVGPLPPWTLVIEHALLSEPAQRERVVRGAFGVTVQHSLLWNMGSEMLQTWGPERTRQVNPLDELLALGASVAAGTDIVAYSADPLSADLDDLPGLTPAFTIVGGRVVHDPGGLLGL
jgi:predicted amidohydrolase YtcJ